MARSLASAAGYQFKIAFEQSEHNCWFSNNKYWPSYLFLGVPPCISSKKKRQFECRIYSGIVNIKDLIDILHNMWICPRVYSMCTWLKGLAKVVIYFMDVRCNGAEGVYMHKEVWHHRRKIRIRTTPVKSSFIFRPASLSLILQLYATRA